MHEAYFVVSAHQGATSCFSCHVVWARTWHGQAEQSVNETRHAGLAETSVFRRRPAIVQAVSEHQMMMCSN